jgi:hypothetical protein
MVDTSVRADEKSNEQPPGGLAPNPVRMDWEELSKDEDGRITNTYLECGDMGTLVDLDGCDLLDGGIRGCETSIGKVGRLEFGQRLLVEFRLETLEDESEV